MISICIPVYQAEKYIARTVEIALTQSYSDLEILIVNDGSTDHTAEVCQDLAKKDSRIRFLSMEKNSGISAVRNRLVAEAKGEFLYFLDDDDSILPETIEESYHLLLKNHADMVVNNIFYVDENGIPLDSLNRQNIMRDEVLTPREYCGKLCDSHANFYCRVANTLFRRSLFENIHFPDGKINEDEAIIHQLACACRRIVTTKKCYYTYVKRAYTITGSPFREKNLDRLDAWAGRVKFFLQKGWNDLAVLAANELLDGLIVAFAKSLYYGVYLNDVPQKFQFLFQYAYTIAERLPKPNLHQRKVLAISSLILRHAPVYIKYLDLRKKIADYGPFPAAKDEIYQLVLRILALLPTQNTLVFESNPEMSGNTYPVYRYLLDKNLNKKYKFVWIGDGEEKEKAENLFFLRDAGHARGVLDKITYMATIATARGLIYSNRLLGSFGRDRISLCLQHGMPLKKSSGTYCVKNQCTAALCVSPYFADTYSSDFRVDKSKMLFAGFPRNDYLLRKNDSLEKFGFSSFDKIIFWLPTFRQRNDKAMNKNVAAYEMEKRGTGIPCMETEEDLRRVNEYCKTVNALLILKPHPMQDLSLLSEIELSHFILLRDEDLQEKNVQLYEILGQTDAMITDYSSVYYDYLLTDKPIGLTIDDIDQYIEKRGFVYRNPLEILKGQYIKNTDDLLDFLKAVVHSDDKAKKERQEVKEKIHQFQDDGATKRVGDYLLEKLL